MTLGLCLDNYHQVHQAGISKLRKEEQIMKCFERSGDISFGAITRYFGPWQRF